MMNPSTSSKISADCEYLFNKICLMFGPASIETKIFAKMRNTLETSTIDGNYTKSCRSCRCPVCGKTRGDAAIEARERYRKERFRAAGIEKSAPVGDHDDAFLDIPDGVDGYSVLELALKAVKADS